MGKFLLSLFCMLVTVMPAIAETITITVNNSSFGGSGTAYGKFTFNDSESGFGIEGWAAKNGGIALAKNGGYLAVTSNNNNYKITSIDVSAKTSSTKTTTLQIKSQPMPYEYNNGIKTDWAGDGKSFDITQTQSDYTYPVANPYFALYNSTDGGMIAISSITINYITTNGPVEPELSFLDETIIIGDEIDLQKCAGFPDLSYTYTITEGSDKISIENGKIRALSLGEAIVRVTTDAVDGEYLAGEGTFKVTVVGKEPKMSFTNASVYGKVNTGVVWQQVTVTEPTSDRGVISYSSSDPEVVAVDAATGQIRPADVKKAGVATITATMAANGDYAEGTAEYLIVVIDPDASIEPGETLFDFTTKDPYGFTSKTDSSYETEVKAIAGGNETVTITFEGNYRSYYGNNAYSLRLAKKNDANPNKFTISVPDGYKITKVGITSSDGTVSINGTNLTKSNGEIVWETDNNVITNSVEFVSSGSKALVISKINVMWDAADSDLEPAQLTFTPNVNGIYVDEVAEINAVNNPKGRTVTYSIAGLNEDEYVIEQVEDKLHVLVTKPGSYTLEARSAAGEGFRDGFAIMRLNVYRHLSVYADEILLDKDEVDTDTEKFITIDVPENANLYYCFASESTPAADETADETADENQLAGYTLYEDGITVPAKTTGTLNFYIANYGYLSPIRKISLGFETGIEEIGAETATGAARVFDLNGREIKGTPDKGIYIRIKDGKAAKIMIK